LGTRRSELFLRGGLDDPNHVESVKEIAIYAHAIFQTTRRLRNDIHQNFARRANQMRRQQTSVEPVARSEMDLDQKLADCPLTSPMLRVVAYLPERPDGVHLCARRSPN
jgi:hypothetical protein